MIQVFNIRVIRLCYQQTCFRTDILSNMKSLVDTMFSCDIEQVPAEYIVYAEVRRCCKGFRDPEYSSY
jgi:archaellum biogenesis ATPase FlaH